MQLFILDRDCVSAVRFLADTHVIKMCLENAQILSGVILNSKTALPPGFPLPHTLNHPVIRAIRTPGQINWVLAYNGALQDEFHYRFGKDHAYRALVRSYREILFQPEYPEDCSDLARTFRDFHSCSSDLIEAHREYYCAKLDRFKRPPCWSRRPVPEWLAAVI